MRLPDKWGPVLASQPETGMGYQVATVIMKDGSQYEHVVIEEGQITRIKGLSSIPFKAHDIADIRITHEKWDFSKDR
jgi:hypothetical protein